MAVVAVRASDSSNASTEDQSVHIINFVTQSMCLVFMTIFFGLRVFSRLKILNGFAIEDCKSPLVRGRSVIRCKGNC